jgi:hypothetical protein
MEVQDAQGMQKIKIKDNSDPALNQKLKNIFDAQETKPSIRTNDSDENLGVIEELEILDDGLYATLQLTDNGAGLIRNESYNNIEILGTEKEITGAKLYFEEKKMDILQDVKQKSKLEILNSIKKLIEKNNYDIDDEKLLELYQIMTTKSMTKKYSFSAELDKTKAVQTIQVFPRKKVYIEKYDEYVDLNDKLFNEMISNFHNPKLFKPYMDVDHSLQEKYADVIDLFKNERGLFAKIELNERGYSAIKNKDYSYVSPEWGDRTDTEKQVHRNCLWAITLTNIPALEGENPTLQEQMKLTKLGGSTMTDFEKRIIKLEKKLETRKLQETPEGGVDPAVLQEAVTEALGMLQELVAKLSEITGQKEVAEEEMAKAYNKLEEVQSSVEQKDKDEFFDKMVELGKVEPSEVDDWSTQFDKDKDFVKKMLEKRPEKKSIQLSKPGVSSAKLSDEDYKLAYNLGYDLNDSKQYRLFVDKVIND